MNWNEREFFAYKRNCWRRGIYNYFILSAILTLSALVAAGFAFMPVAWTLMALALLMGFIGELSRIGFRKTYGHDLHEEGRDGKASR